MQTVTRSAGVPTGHVIAPLCGSGYHGATAELDAVVEEGARLLAGAFGIPVTIRFNSNRLSGGAWLVTSPGPDGIGQNTDIEIGAGLFPERDAIEAITARIPDYRDGWREAVDALPRTVQICAYASERVLKDRTLAANGYVETRSASPADALAWLVEHIDASRLAVVRNLPGKAIPAAWLAERWSAWCGDCSWTRLIQEFGELGGWAVDWGGVPHSKSAIPLTFELFLQDGTKLSGKHRLKDIRTAISQALEKTSL